MRHDDCERTGRARAVVTSTGTRLPEGTRRTVRLSLLLRPGEARDLAAVAGAWGVPTATAAWALIHDSLRRARGRAPLMGAVGQMIALSLRVLGRDLEAEVMERASRAEASCGK